MTDGDGSNGYPRYARTRARVRWYSWVVSTCVTFLEKRRISAVWGDTSIAVEFPAFRPHNGNGQIFPALILSAPISGRTANRPVARGKL